VAERDQRYHAHSFIREHTNSSNGRADSRRAIYSICAAGASILTLSANKHIDGAACAALSTISGVTASGAIRAKTDPVVALALPSSTVPVWEVTQGFPEILGIKLSADTGVVISDQLAETLQLASGDILKMSESTTGIDGRRPGYGYGILAPVPNNDPFDECWAEVWPMSQDTRSLLYSTLIPGEVENAQIVYAQLNTTLGAVFDNTRFSDRITKYCAIIGGIFGLALSYLAVRIRKVEHASALHAGLDKTSLPLLTMIEMFSWLLATVILSASLTIIFTATTHSNNTMSLYLLAAKIVGLTTLGVYCGTLIAISLAKENQLFRHLKNRS